MQIALRGCRDLSGGMVRLSDATLPVRVALLLIKGFCRRFDRLRGELRLERCSPSFDISTKLLNCLFQLVERGTHILELKYRRARLGLRGVVDIFFDGEFDAIDNFELIRDCIVEIRRLDNPGEPWVVTHEIKGHWNEIE